MFTYEVCHEKTDLNTKEGSFFWYDNDKDLKVYFLVTCDNYDMCA